MSRRKHRLVDCSPHWVKYRGREDQTNGLYLECPEGHDDCRIVIPFSPALDGQPSQAKNALGVTWQRQSGDSFENLTLTPSIRNTPKYKSKEEALADGVKEEHFSEHLLCALHINITNGRIEFCGDSK